MSDDISTEAERVKFLQAAAQIMLAKARMKLNLKRLYAADGTAVRELLKLAELLHRATQTAASNDEVRQQRGALRTAARRRTTQHCLQRGSHDSAPPRSCRGIHCASIASAAGPTGCLWHQPALYKTHSALLCCLCRMPQTQQTQQQP